MKKVIFSIFALLVMKPAPAQVPTTGLIAYYPFCGNANDASGNGNNGIVTGAALTTDRFGNPNSAYDFNGINNYISLPPASFAGLNIFSCSLWMRPTSNANPGNNAFCIGSSTDPYCWGINYNPPSVFAGCYNNGSNPVQSYVNSSPIPSINTWIHVVVTRDLSNLTLYINGTMVQQLPGGNTNNQAVNYGTAPYAAIIGARSNLQTFFPGQIDDIRMYSKVITQSDITALYNEAAFAVSVNSGTICRGGSFTITPGGAASYTVTGGSLVVSPTVTTSYTITGNNGGCRASAVSSVAVSLCTGIDPLNQNQPGFIVYPNPGNGNIFIQLNGIKGKSGSFILKDVQGRIVKTIDLDLKPDLFEINTGLPPGSYMADLVIDGNNIYKKRIVIFNP